MDVVKQILASPVSATKGEGVMKGQILEPEVRIVKAKRPRLRIAIVSPRYGLVGGALWGLVGLLLGRKGEFP
jgi:hypothetical protein